MTAEVVLPPADYQLSPIDRAIYRAVELLFQQASRAVGHDMAFSLMLSVTMNRMMDKHSPEVVAKVLRDMADNLPRVKRWNDAAAAMAAAERPPRTN